MFLAIATTHRPATDLGYLLHSRIWAEQIAADLGYAADLADIGAVDETLGAPTQIALFTRLST